MKSKENFKKGLIALGIALSTIGGIGNQIGLTLIGGALAIIGTILIVK